MNKSALLLQAINTVVLTNEVRATCRIGFRKVVALLDRPGTFGSPKFAEKRQLRQHDTMNCCLNMFAVRFNSCVVFVFLAGYKEQLSDVFSNVCAQKCCKQAWGIKNMLETVLAVVCSHGPRFCVTAQFSERSRPNKTKAAHRTANHRDSAQRTLHPTSIRKFTDARG